LTSTSGHSIVIAPIGNLGLELFESVAGEIERIFGRPTRMAPLLQDLSFAFDPLRKQYHSTRILEKLAAKAPSKADKILGIVEVDLFIPILTHVYGEAQLGGKACVVSTFRLNEERSNLSLGEPFLSRIIKEAVHELGHTFKLRHCPDPLCLMHYCRNELDVDRKSNEFCRYCKILLEDELKKESSSVQKKPG
jgi:archaemetzincin